MTDEEKTALVDKVLETLYKLWADQYDCEITFKKQA